MCLSVKKYKYILKLYGFYIERCLFILYDDITRVNWIGFKIYEHIIANVKTNINYIFLYNILLELFINEILILYAH